MSANLELALRWANVVVGFLAGVAVLWAAFGINKRGKPELLGLIGGALLCFAVSLGTLGIIFGFESIYRLPIITAALTYVLVGRVAQMVAHYRNERCRTSRK